jgi:hypothetical protein
MGYQLSAVSYELSEIRRTGYKKSSQGLDTGRKNRFGDLEIWEIQVTKKRLCAIPDT